MSFLRSSGRPSPFIADKGSFTLVSGVLTDKYLHGDVIETTINHLVEGFAKVTESVAYHAYFSGFIPVSAWEVGQAHLRAISTLITGRILKLHKTNC
jgi:hypothetical protein